MRIGTRGLMATLITLASPLTPLMASQAQAKPRPLEAEITRTTYGIPHITARNWKGIGYGVGYAYAQDNLCMLAEDFITMAGQRALHFGTKEKTSFGFDPVDNLASDVFFKSQFDIEALRKAHQQTSATTRDLVRGYVAGYNRLLRDLGPQGVPASCRGKAWVKPISEDDMLRLMEKNALRAGALVLAQGIAYAAPPAVAKPEKVADLSMPDMAEAGLGSNGWAFGAETTANGKGLIVGNPHFPWAGTSRFYQLHITIPGVVDVMGATLAGSPIPTIGFNKDIAWSHTVSAAKHATVFELTLDPTDPTRYMVDGKSEAMQTRTVSIETADGTLTRTVYVSRFGPLLIIPNAGLNWTNERAFAVRDANAGNNRLIDAWLQINQARSVEDIRNAVTSTLGIPWVNTIATDRQGHALLADVTVVPNVSGDKIRACATARSAPLAQRLIVLDGSKSACDWDKVAGTPAPGLMPAQDQAVIIRRDYVANSNDSYWLTNPKAPYRVLSPILGSAETARSLRTRSGLIEIDRRLSGTDGLAGQKVDQDTAKAMAFANKTLAGELTLDSLISLCVDQADLADACAVLKAWDRRYDNDSKGAYLFHAFWEQAERIQGKWAKPFDLNDPVHTPADLITTGPVADQLRAALKAATERLKSENIALDAPWGQVQFVTRGQENIPIHGAHGNLGVLNVQVSDKGPRGLVPRSGTSYIQVVSFTDQGPVADAILSYSQSTDPDSPHYADQTLAYAAKRWNRLPFTPAEINAARIGPTLKLRE
ncbi:acyl-homoserine lactone acylase PvdQ [Candidatus Phycosocius bacilliformis]|uniref:Acyl-homoserine lactone acylase PvdQ n=1 Tax=Candidatus Phycosocius bacilliformis TaxID=1445552 RepID=A0A2P2EE94_9PROT|nr:penicillin acylase family protein [Candidatus Phycosocius bacilliformis]GBF59383.1 acyl-homoserine lactone acylase PvdQ [Candidatus Phycosocius bacilliformis]